VRGAWVGVWVFATDSCGQDHAIQASIALAADRAASCLPRSAATVPEALSAPSRRRKNNGKVSGHVGLNSRVYRCERSAIEDEDSCDNCEREGNGASALAPQSSSRPRRFPDFRQSIGFGLCQRGWAIKNKRRRSNLSFEDSMHRGKVRFEKEIEKPKAALISSFLTNNPSAPARGRLCALPQVPHLSAAA